MRRYIPGNPARAMCRHTGIQFKRGKWMIFRGGGKMKKIGFLIFGMLFIVVAPACNSDRTATTDTQSAAGDCDRACLEQFADRYIDALVAHDPSAVPLAEDVKFTENGVELKVGDALWATASGKKDYRIYITEPETAQVGYSGIIEENGKPALISFRLKIADGAIAEIEQIVARDDGQFNNVKNLTEPDPIYAEILKPEEQSSREDMIATADSYFAALERNDGTRPVNFADTCNRQENGFQTTNNPPAEGQPADEFNIMALSCKEQFKTGFFKFVTRIRRRHLVVDKERGLVFSVACLDHAGNVKEVTMTNGMTLPVTLSSPTTFLGGGCFKIKNEQIHRIYTVMITPPYGMRQGWE
jgi:hypothetical protein